MSPDKYIPTGTPEHEPGRLESFPLHSVVEALRDENLPTEHFVWLSDVVEGDLPGGQVAEQILAIKKIRLGPMYASNPQAAELIRAAVLLLEREYELDIKNTEAELNVFLASRPNVFIIEKESATLVALEMGSVGLETTLRYETTAGYVEHENNDTLLVDTTRLRPEEQEAISRYIVNYGV